MSSDDQPSSPSVNKDIAFSTPSKYMGVPVSVYLTRNEKPGAPPFNGRYGGKRFGLYIRNGSRGIFLSLSGEKGGDGKYENLGTANITAVSGGLVKLVIRFSEAPNVAIWLDTFLSNVPQDLLVRAGLDLKKLEEKKREAQESSKNNQ